MERAEGYLQSRDSQKKDSELCRIYMRRIEHLYYKVKLTFQSLLYLLDLHKKMTYCQ